MEIHLKRIAKRATYTIGRLYIDGQFVCDTIEDCDRGLNNKMAEADIKKIKVCGETAIPTGTYNLVRHKSPRLAGRAYGKRYNGIFPMVENVPGFSGILFHPMNKAEDSLGCIGPGENKVVGGVIRSTQAYYNLMDNYFIPAWDRGEAVRITIE